MIARIRLGILIAALPLVFFFGCVSTVFRPAGNLEPLNLTPISPADVRVLTSPPRQAFSALGEIKAYVSGYPSEETIFRRVRERAAAIGADAVVLDRGRDMLWTEPAAGNAGESEMKLVYVRFEAIRLLPGGAPERRP